VDISACVVALGSGASHALNHLLRTGGLPATVIAANTDVQDLRRSLSPTKLQLGASVVRGLGCGGDAEVGRDAALADREPIAQALAGAELVIVLAGLGGGTGSGAAPVVCGVASDLGIPAIAVVTLPFPFEGRRRRRVADEALVALRQAADGRVVVADTPVPPEGGERLPMQALFARSDASVAAIVRAATDIAAGGTGGDELEPGLLTVLRGHLARPARH
jgi:cell division protein FtsZ